jgi:putative FmdB family regulatory protein
MPIYQYECNWCRHSFEEIQKITSDVLEKCPKCSKWELRRVPQKSISFSLVGSGFHKNDYPK